MESGRQLYGRILVGLMNLIALAAAIELPVGYASQNPAAGKYFIPLAAVLPLTIVFASIPILTTVFSIRWLRRRARERRALAPETPLLLPESSDSEPARIRVTGSAENAPNAATLHPPT